MIAIEPTRDAVLGEVSFARRHVQTNLVRLEESSEAIEVRLRDWVVLVIVALRTIHRQAEEGLRGVFDGIFHPSVAVEDEVLPGQEAVAAQLVGIGRIEFVGGKHLAQHLVVALVAIQRFDDPVTPVPHVLLAIANFDTKTPPIRIAPDVHPVATPALAVLLAAQQSFDDGFICRLRLSGIFLLERVLFLARGRQPDQIEIDAPQQHTLVGQGLSFQPVLLAFGS